MKTICLCGFLIITGTLSGAEPKPIQKLTEAELQARLQQDAREVTIHRKGLRDVIRFVESRPDVFPVRQAKESRLLRREEKEVVWTTWQRFLDYLVALDSTGKYHANWFRLKGDAKEDSFLISYAAMLAKYRAALEFIERIEHNPELDKVLNDAVPELGLPAGTYAQLKFNYLHVRIATEFAASEVVMKTFNREREPELRKGIKADAGYLWDAGKGRGEVLTAKNALKVVQNGANSAWLPVQTGVSEWMGDTKVYRPGRSLVAAAQVEQLKTNLVPGDLLLERREWYLSNVGLPGFWSHAALYVGTPEQRRSFFADVNTQLWVRQQGETSGELEALLQTTFPSAYKKSTATQEHGHMVRVIEAISEGVSFTTLEHSANCDSLAVLRPRLSKAGKARAVTRTFHYAGRPYDFNFDFSTDAELVCTELVYKAYESGVGFSGLQFPLVEMLGRKVTPANDIAKQFDAQFGTADQQFDLVIFLDGREREKKAVVATLADFRASWQRPKWHIVVQK